MENAVVAASTLDRLVRRCDWASSRKQVYELLTDLMVDSPANYREGLKSLQRLHLQVGSIQGPGQQCQGRMGLVCGQWQKALLFMTCCCLLCCPCS